MKTVFLRNGTAYKPTDEADLDMHNQLPAGNFIVVEDPLTERLYLQQVEDFTVPSKLYGNIEARARRVLNTYRDRTGSTGALFSGEKGSGKTQLARLIAVYAARLGIPCVIINQPWVGDEFNRLVQSISQECVFFFDEFEKVYDSQEQKQVLTLLDGVFPSKKLFLLTCNDKWLIDDHMRNRPGRIFYLLDFRGLDQDFIDQYCQDVLVNKSHIPTLKQIAQMFSEFNFDMLKAIVEEMNRYDESPEEALEMLNARPSTDNEGEYAIALEIDGVEYPRNLFYPSTWEGSPMHEQEINVTFNGVPDGDGDDVAVSSPSAASTGRPRRPGHSAPKRQTFTIRQSHLRRFDADRGEFVYELSDDNVAVRFTRIRRSEAKFFELLA